MADSPDAGRPADAAHLVDVSKLIAASFAERPDPAVAAERVAFGTRHPRVGVKSALSNAGLTYRKN